MTQPSTTASQDVSTLSAAEQDTHRHAHLLATICQTAQRSESLLPLLAAEWRDAVRRDARLFGLDVPLQNRHPLLILAIAKLARLAGYPAGPDPIRALALQYCNRVARPYGASAVVPGSAAHRAAILAYYRITEPPPARDADGTEHGETACPSPTSTTEGT